MKVSAEQLDLALRRMLYLQLPLDTRNWIVRVVLRKFQIAMLQVEFAVLTWIPITNCTIIVCLWPKEITGFGSGLLFLPGVRIQADWAKDFIYLTMLASWISVDFEWPENPVQVIEYFAGVSRICKLASWYGVESRGFELLFDTPPKGTSSHSNMPRRSAYDFCGEAGFLLFGGIGWVSLSSTRGLGV